MCVLGGGLLIIIGRHKPIWVQSITPLTPPPPLHKHSASQANRRSTRATAVDPVSCKLLMFTTMVLPPSTIEVLLVTFWALPDGSKLPPP